MIAIRMIILFLFCLFVSCSNNASEKFIGLWKYSEFSDIRGMDYIEIEVTKDSIFSSGYHDMFVLHKDKYVARKDSVFVFNQMIPFTLSENGELITEYAGRRIVMSRIIDHQKNRNAAVRFIELIVKEQVDKKSAPSVLKDVLWKSYFPEVKMGSDFD